MDKNDDNNLPEQIDVSEDAAKQEDQPAGAPPG